MRSLRPPALSSMSTRELSQSRRMRIFVARTAVGGHLCVGVEQAAPMRGLCINTRAEARKPRQSDDSPTWAIDLPLLTTARQLVESAQ